MAGAALIGIGSSVGAHAANDAHMALGGYTSQPIGHYEYCKTYRSDCSIKTRTNSVPKLTRPRWNELVEVNVSTNTSIMPVKDIDLFGVEEVWSYPAQYGDCEDYALVKRKKLMDKGWPASSLLITVVKQPNGEGHAILTVRTDRGDYVLDNVTNTIKIWNQTRYTFLKRQSWENSGKWQSIIDPRLRLSRR